MTDEAQAEAVETTETTEANAPDVQEAVEAEKVEAGAGDKEAAPDDGEKEAAVEVPSYDELKIPENFELDADKYSAFKDALAKEQVSADTAQALIDMHVTAMQGAADAWSDTVKEWREQLNADKEFGGRHRESTRTRAANAIDKFGSQALREYFDQTGLGDYPELVKAFARVGDVLAEATTEPAGGQSADPLAALYPSMNQ